MRPGCQTTRRRRALAPSCAGCVCALASGAGKSSFVRAGLIAAIRAAAPGNSSPRVVVLTPGEHPLHQLAGALGSGEDGIGTGALADELRADPSALRRVTSHAGDAPLVVAVDQFEELFTLCRDEPERRCFVDALIVAWRDPSSPVVVIVALRADFYGHAAAYPELADAVVAHQTLLGALSAADLRRAIELPAARRGLLLQPGLVETILDDLGEEPGALPLLSHALPETWKRRSRLMLTVDGYRKAGGMRTIAQTAEHTLQLLSEQDRSIARLIFLSLTEVGEGSAPTRRRMDREELSAASRRREAAEGVLETLADARLVSVDERTVVVAHEALIRHWPRLRGWIDDDRGGLLIHRRLTEAAREWKHLSRDPGALDRGARLAAAREWATDLNVLSPLERAFLTASESAQHSDLKAAKRTTRRLRVFATGLAVLAWSSRDSRIGRCISAAPRSTSSAKPSGGKVKRRRCICMRAR
ncbi:MAG: hypothetical protein QOF69_3255 [Solirubrobacteraceae bacterium]|nr:hypothetical protein [Solirubrobacteraceae bacterium]